MTALGAGLAPSKARVQSANSTNATLIKNGAGSLSDANLTNNAAAVAFIKFYDLNRLPVVGTDVPFLTWGLAASNVSSPYQPVNSLAFSNGLAYSLHATAAGAADSDTTAVAANQITGNIEYF